ncbi:MAG: hypothetical protein KC503_28750 [Myxococcales bacterium]|nr:hypothetical protein [Myxococcales bacterium]
MGEIQIREVDGAADRKRFIKMPWSLYKDDPLWVPPLIGDMKEFLNPQKGVFFGHGEAKLFLAERDGVCVGRISAQINHAHDKLFAEQGKAFFGFFECEDNQQTADALFDAAEAYAREHGKTCIEGPLNFGIYDEIGVLIEGFDTPPYVLNLHNPPYYQKLIESAGYGKSIDWFAYRGKRGETTFDVLDKRFIRLRDALLKRIQRRGTEVTFREMNMKDFDRESMHVKRIFDSAWDHNWGHVPMTDDEFLRVSKAIKMLIIPELSFFAEVDGQPVAFALSVYDANVAAKKMNGRLFPMGWTHALRVKKTDRFRLVLMGVLDEYRGRGFEVIFYVNVIEKASSMHFNEAEMSLIVENNEPMIRSIENLPVERYKTYRIFIKDLA